VRLSGLEPGDEVIMPSFTFASCANAVMAVGAVPVFVDIRPDTLNIDERGLAAALSTRTRAILPVHYAGVSCEMEPIMAFARQHALRMIEDAAQAVGSAYDGRALGTFGDLGAFSFHYTKNLVSGEGGAIAINDPALVQRAHVMRDKGTNRRQFMLGQVDKYTWVDFGSSYIPSELSMALLLAQLEVVDEINIQRRHRYRRYIEGLLPQEKKGRLRLPSIPVRASSNFHIFFILLEDEETRGALLRFLADRGIQATFHYIPLHSAPAGRHCRTIGAELPVTDRTARCILRLPLFPNLTDEQQDRVIAAVDLFFSTRGGAAA
jgi:dTDP-4-amino-4,6-dideoxygalactose transaminase